MEVFEKKVVAEVRVLSSRAVLVDRNISRVLCVYTAKVKAFQDP